MKWNISKLKDAQTRHNFASELTKHLQISTPSGNIEEDWQVIKKVVADAAQNVLGEREKTRKEEWYDEEYARLLRKKNEGRLECFQNNSDENMAIYKKARDLCRKIPRRKKRILENNRIRELESTRMNNRSRAFYKRVNALRRGYQPRTGNNKGHKNNTNGEALIEKHDVVNR